MKNLGKAGIAAGIAGGVVAVLAAIGGALAQKSDSNTAAANNEFDNAVDQYNANNTDQTYTETTAPAAEPAPEPEAKED